MSPLLFWLHLALVIALALPLALCMTVYRYLNGAVEMDAYQTSSRRHVARLIASRPQ
jgi:hypothetical protein